MKSALSLRIRLTLIILIPLLVIAGLIGIWAVDDARLRANDQFDRSLLSAVLAVSRDVALSDGDALSPGTNRLLRDTSGGAVFYHVYAPDGVFVTGYATPPVAPAVLESDQQAYFDANYQGRDVRALRFRDAMQIDGLSGDFTFTVWQDTSLRQTIVRRFSVMAALVIALALIVWFGVRFGLSPLIDLQSAIAQRSSDDLAPIRRAVPYEARGIVATLNQLLGQVTSTMQAKDDFISNAAHQIRNPIAGVVAMSEAVQSAKSFEDMKTRSADLVAAAKHASNLANKMLAFERAKAIQGPETFARFDIVELLETVVAKSKGQATDVKLVTDLPTSPVHLVCDQVMLGEAVTNLINNALEHGGNDVRHITVSAEDQKNQIVITVADDGVGIAPEKAELALQLDQSGGTGLGLPISLEVAQKHGGTLSFPEVATGLTVQLTLPRS